MKQTKKIVISAMLVALSVTMMYLGGFTGVADLAACAIASLLVALAYIELHSPYTWLVWLASSSVMFMLSQPAVGAEYLLVFGIYPIIKAYIERAPRPFWWPIKMAYINITLWILILLVDGVLGVPIFEGEDTLIFKIILYIVSNVAFVVYDLFITVMIRFYFARWRRVFARFFK